MDKKKKTQQPAIKIKINGEERPFEEEITVNDWQVAAEETSASAEKADEEDVFDWVLPETEYKEVSEFQKVNYFPSKHKKHPSQYWRRKSVHGVATMILSIFLAVAVGLLLGTFLLKMVMNPDEQPVSGDDSIAAPPVVSNDDVKKQTVEPYIAELPALTTAVIQGDVYSSKSAAENRMAEYDAQGFGTMMMETEGKYYVFVGIADNITKAKAWEQDLKDKGMNVWAKELSMKKVEMKFTSKQEAELFASEGKLFQLLAGEAMSGIMSGKVNETSVADIGKQLDTGEGTRSEDGVVHELYSELYAAYEGLRQYQSNADDKSVLKKVQQHLLDYIKLYEGARQ
ncbi:hypothetical protein [Lederbergia lenta]|uniref:Stage II sporulation protein B n=1 Tax=Lederbergia lenta TaxID=1467 RepID=A0A2X4Z565_LEDLE|nr:hypothetical protein [Lederbergia lenta]MCM3111269.1 hypothetical protein [Lederbergia lenta]MEC2325343.1 hypothetical protein [Lederbergia lenta]SQI55794.1 stage II sporulation protein B [Lederbergia lenta]